MNRPARMMLIIGVMVLLGLSALFFMARRLRTAVIDAPAEPVAAAEMKDEAGDDPIPVPVIQGDTAEAVAGMPEEPDAPAPETEADPLQDKIAVFADARYAIREWMDKYPKTRDSIQKELTNTVDTEKVRMYNYEFMEIRLARSRPLRAAGMEEAEYFSIREQYRAWLTGEGDLDPAYKAAFDAAPPEILERASLGEYEGFDY